VRNREISFRDHDQVADALAHQEPLWQPGSAHGYHPRTYGFLVDELVRRISKVSVGSYFREVFAAPLGLDLWIGLPEELAKEVAPIYAPRRNREASDEDAFYAALADQESLTFHAFSTPAGLTVPSVMKPPRHTHPLFTIVRWNWHGGSVGYVLLSHFLRTDLFHVMNESLSCLTPLRLVTIAFCVYRLHSRLDL